MEARYIVDENGKRTDVILPVEEYERPLKDVLATRAYDGARAELERGEDGLIPREQARREIEEERAIRGHQDAV